MPANGRARLDRLRRQLDVGDRDVADKDRDALRDFSDALALRRSRCGDHRHEKLLRHCTIMAESTDDGTLASALTDRTATEHIVRWINRTYDNEETNRDYRVALRVFGRHTTDVEGTDPPDSIDWVPSDTPRNYDPTPDPARMLRWDTDVLPMIEAAQNRRDEALIAVSFDLGPRSGESQTLAVGDVTDGKYGPKVTLDGKTGRRSPTLIPSVPYLNQWLAAHPGRNDPTAPLWSKLSVPEPLSEAMFRKCLSEPASRAGVTKPVTPTAFRKSSASYLAGLGMSQAHIEDHHGWVRGSRVAARYISIFAEDADRELARVHGVDVEADEPDHIGPIECPRCERETPRHESLCVWCHQALSPDAAEVVDEQQDDLRRALAAESGAESVALADLGALLDEHPVLRDMIPRSDD